MNTLQNLRESIDRFVLDYVVDNGDSSTARGQAFAFWCSTTLFGLSTEQAQIATDIGGRSDNSIDAFFQDEEGTTVLQCKYGNHQWSEVTKFYKDVERLLTDPPTGGRQAILQTGARLRTPTNKVSPYAATTSPQSASQVKIPPRSPHSLIMPINLHPGS